MAITAETLYANYRKIIEDLVSIIVKEKEAGIPKIISGISTQIVPAMMTDLGKIASLSGTEKRDLIIEAIDLSIKEIFEELNRIPELAQANWDEALRDILRKLIPSLINLLIKVENNQIKFNKKFSRCNCCLLI